MHDAAPLAANALVGSRLDYCNSLFKILSALDPRMLQYVQNNLARIIANTTKYSHILQSVNTWRLSAIKVPLELEVFPINHNRLLSTSGTTFHAPAFKKCYTTKTLTRT